jgi:cyclic beta-1,2-glucan synthetase
LVFDPCIPKEWRSYSIIYQHENTRYEISVENPNGVSHGIDTIELDGECQLNGNSITLQDDGLLHQVRVVLG